MPDRIEVFDVTIPAGTAIATPQETALSFQRGRVDRLEIHVPPGPSGLVGFRIGHSGQSIVPRSGDAWVIADGQTLDWDLSNYPTGSAWFFAAYNTDEYIHTIQVRFHVTELGLAPVNVVQPVAIYPLAESEDIGLLPEEEV